MRDFFKKNLQNIITNERSITPDPKFTILRLGLKNYYETFQPFNKKCGFNYFEGQNSKNLSIAINHDFITTSYSSIILIHLFFEHYLNEILFKIKPILLYGKFNKELDLINALTNNWDNIPQNDKKKIDFNHQLTRLTELIRNDSSLPDEFKVPSKYHFILNHKEALEELSYQRNEIIHLGDKILAKYAYDLLMINYIIPLIYEVFSIENDIDSLNRNTHCNINIINELFKVRLKENHLEDLNLTKTELKKICHLKELGRASFENPLGMFEYGGDAQHKEQLETIHNKPLRDNAINEAMLRIYIDKAYKIHNCPCCGTNSLITFEIWEYFNDNSKWVEKAKCFLCTYSINKEIGEPSDFGIKCEQLFERIE